MNKTGKRLARARLPEGVDGITRLHALIGEHLDAGAAADAVVIGIETDRGPWVAALVAPGYFYAWHQPDHPRFRQPASPATRANTSSRIRFRVPGQVFPPNPGEQYEQDALEHQSRVVLGRNRALVVPGWAWCYCRFHRQ